MAKVTLTIEGKNKIFTKDKLNLGAMKAQAEFEAKLQNSFGYMDDLQNLYRKHRTILGKIERENEKLQNVETDEEVDAIYEKIDELENTEEYAEFEAKAEELNKKAEEDTETNNFEVFDEFAQLLVTVFDDKFTVDEVFKGLSVENSLPETYSKIFANNDTGKRKKATTTKAKAQTK
ncbi:phage tail assembly chaperone G [Staphylococcus gallinarum]|uniref:phage tail assembly chaperone G n=1 Tax=Staphylococcus gallinarum TaxID=1293 RepID=UPI001E57C954|nr:hypothetical protein [Staphylococcus gallinarum]MCD8821187.1 hypothetical protein [Staphylococcus gallinarum]MCD8872130.1 hypothetical protein [Staphylococcus gallinarum]